RRNIRGKKSESRLVGHSVCFSSADSPRTTADTAHFQLDHVEVDGGPLWNAVLPIRLFHFQHREMNLPEVGNLEYVANRAPAEGPRHLMDQRELNRLRIC